MNSHLKDTLEIAYKLCDALEKTDVWDKSNTAPAREIFRGELFHFLINLSFSDAKISANECKFIKDYIGYEFSPKELREYAVANRIYGAGFTTDIPYCFKAFVKADNTLGEVKETSKLILNVYKQLGQEFIKLDSIDSTENYTLTSICNNMQEYIDKTFVETVNMTLGNINAENKKVCLPNKTISAPKSEKSTEAKKDEDKKSEEKEKSLDELMTELNELIGLKKVKSDVQSLINLVKIRKIREERGFKNPSMSLHMVFSGNPGTGKTTIARLLAQIYKAMGLLSKGHLIETDRSGLVGGYVGQTAIKVKEVAEKAKGGVLFIDEAYSLTVNRGSSDYGFEAVDTLLKYMEDNRDDLIVIVAGYPEPMEEFLNSNPGLKSRFNKYLYFNDYTPEELMGILKMRANKSKFKLSDEADKFCLEFFTKRVENKPVNYANGRDVRNFLEKALVNQANRLAAITETITDEQLSTIELSDVNTVLL